jgi:dTDP-4-dehydrorhamnose reductase
MRILVLGGSGMLGHKMVQLISEAGHDVAVTFRSGPPVSPWYASVLQGVTVHDSCDAEQPGWVGSVIDDFNPAAVINCVGIVKQRVEAHDHIASLRVNALFPHLVAKECARAGSRFVHVSTDCVFDGTQGAYSEEDAPTARDLYGRSKFLGEVHDAPALTLRTSIIGRELSVRRSLLEWFLSRDGASADGFRRALYSGVTTHHLTGVVSWILESFPGLTGLYHVSSPPISKYDLLLMLRDAFGLDVEIVPEDETAIDRTLDGTRFAAATGYRCPEWPELCRDLAEDPAEY